MITIGVDFHKRTSSYCVLDENGKRVKRCKFENRPELIEDFLQSLPGPKQLAMEATRNWGLFYEVVKPHVDEFLLGHPKKMKAITESETKHDQKDAEVIGRLAASGFFPQAHASPSSTRELRSVLRFRHFLVKERVAIRNQTQILLDRNLWPCQRPTAFKNIFCKRGLLWLESVSLPERERFILNQLIIHFHELNEKIEELESFVHQQAGHLPGIEHLRTIPGLKNSKVHLFVILLEIDDIKRFRKARHLAHYAGLIPSEHSSGDKHRTGRLVKGANVFLRTALLESVFGILHGDPEMKRYYQSVKLRRGSGAAIIACTRKLSYAVYHVLKDQVPYQFHPPVTASGPYAVSH